MESIREIYRIGRGPSSSHTMAPRKAAESFRRRHPEAKSFRVTLFGSLAATGRGHMTDAALGEAFAPHALEIVWKPEEELPAHPNGMRFEALDGNGEAGESWTVYSVGGGALSGEGDAAEERPSVYGLSEMTAILERCEAEGRALWEYVEECEDGGLWDFLGEVWRAMLEAVERGVRTEGALPGPLGLARKAWSFHRRAQSMGQHFRQTALLSAYALAAAEENATGGLIVTAPTCGSCGVVPAALRYVKETVDCDEPSILRALATAGLVGNLIKQNASISGAEVGCQGEIGSACAMAAAGAAQLLGGSPRQVEYAAEMGLEHHLGLTCDPVAGLVQVPCIERNAFAATRALNCCDYALFSDAHHLIPFDEVVGVMGKTGHDLPSLYRETAAGGLAEAYRQRKR